MSSNSGKIAIDAMGADLGTEEILLGVKLALETYTSIPHITLVGDSAIIQTILERQGISNHPKLSIFHASEVIGMDEKPIQSLKQKKDSSLVRSIDLVKEKAVDAVISCGNTGSLMACATLKLRTMPGVERPAISSIIPSKDHHFILLDAGANPSTTARQLVHNAILGSNHCATELGVKKPKVGLLSIGTEEGKGNETTEEAHRLLKSINGVINYNGLIEGFHVFERDIDVVVCDGFVGNILIKTCESLFHMLQKIFREELTSNPWRKMGALLSLGAFRDIREKFNPDKHGAAPLLGINGMVFKAHGSSSRHVIMNAIGNATKMIQQDVNAHIQSDIEEANRIMQAVKDEAASKRAS